MFISSLSYCCRSHVGRCKSRIWKQIVSSKTFLQLPHFPEMSTAYLVHNCKIYIFRCWLPHKDSHYQYIYIVPILAVLLVTIYTLWHKNSFFVITLEELILCRHTKTWVRHCFQKLLLILQVNVIVLGSIVYVLVTKLHATNTLQARQYRYPQDKYLCLPFSCNDDL